MSKCLLNSNQTEYFCELARERGTSILSSTFLEGEDEESPVDFNKTISDEVDFGTMEVKRDFLTRFLVRKQVELSEILSSRRTRNYTRRDIGNNPKYVKFKEKNFNITEYDGEENVTGDVLDENVLLSIVGKESSGKSKGPCPIKCGRNHINSSCFLWKV